MTKTDCKTCLTYLPDLLLGGTDPQPEMTAHLADCVECRREADDLRATFALMDQWTAPEPSAYFDSRLHARLREAQAAPPEGLWERFSSYLRFSTGRGVRPAMAGALALGLLLGGSTAATLVVHHGWNGNPSPTVNDLRIYDNNAQAIQQMDMLDESGPDQEAAPAS